ncbi:MAG TPA: bifunctional homocysteine S-methyltransferase/methylenetetrahydrofolate reductase [Pyrinomonadaceae bacterium]|nr:bifunctional homocysteine S-methyltransferase/methylenetetrahydrofolate reductase [Pyrinomonadaceae bacterium]
MDSFRNVLDSDRIHVVDGAMGTMLYAKGVYINRCYDELNLSSPDLVQEIHAEYIRAGADIIETNTFGATAYKLQQYGLEQNLHEINARAAQIARKAAANDRAWVAGALGPLGLRIEPYGPTSFDEAKDMFKTQIIALLEGGVDLFCLETFSDVSEIRQAIAAVRELCDLPIIAQMTIMTDGNTLFGTTPELFTERLDNWGADVIGLNCGVGPAIILNALERMREVTKKKLSAQPNAGLPRDVQGRQFYMCSPEYMSKFAKRFIQSGAKFIGGCCGTTPSHIKLISDSVRAASPRAQSIAFSSGAPATVESTGPDIKVVPPEERSKWGRKIARGEFVTSVEVLPPKGVETKKTLDSIRLLKDAGVDGVNIPDGARAQSRMSALATAVLVEQQIGIETVLHYCCRDRNLLGMMSDLIGAAALGLRNILVITGDPPKMGPYPDATAVFDIDAIGLTNMVNKLNHGLDLGNNPIGEPTSFCIGVGVNPGAINLDEEIKRFEWKVEAGAQYAITQPVFDTDQLRQFLQRIEHVRIPIIAGIWPLVSYRNAEFLHNEVPGVRVTPSIMDRMRKAAAISKEAGRDEGLRIARESLMEVRDEIQGVQVSAPFGNVKYALEVFEVLTTDVAN